MKITHQDQHEMTVLTLKGELTGDESDRLRRVALERMDARVRDFVLDVRELDAIDSQGLETFVWLQDQCAERLGQIRLAGGTDALADVLKITRLAARFESHADPDSAVHSLGVHHA
ncbi:MAG: STAS domain-containing protein [Planctomycetota bacterium]